MNESKRLMMPALATAVLTCSPLAYASAPTPPCSGASTMLGLLDRPTVGDSSCVVPEGMTVIEAGASAGTVYGSPPGQIDTLPNLELRWGLPGNSEFLWLPPNFQYQSLNAAAEGPAQTIHGFGPTTIGIKHSLGYTEHWQWTAEALTTLPSGDSTFGTHAVGGAINGIVNYSNGPLGVSLMVGVTSETEPTAVGGQRFQSFNPDLVMTWAATSRLQFYGEVYAQSQSGYGQGWGADFDGGLQYLINPDFEVDLEEGVRLQGQLGGFSNYTGVGVGLML